VTSGASFNRALRPDGRAICRGIEDFEQVCPPHFVPEPSGSLLTAATLATLALLRAAQHGT